MLSELQSLLSIPELETEARGDIDRCQVEVEQVKVTLFSTVSHCIIASLIPSLL